MMRVLVLNVGSSSLKWTVLEENRRDVAAGSESWSWEGGGSIEGAVRAILDRAPAVDVVGHRIVHGGTHFRDAVVLDDDVRHRLESLADLDPQHMRASLAAIDAVTERFPEVPQVAAFDTAFHAGLPEPAAGYALPFEWTERWGLRRFGFHGLSVSYAAERTAELLGRLPARVIVCHLGSGCSVTALRDGRSADTTMGFSPLEGLVMATRSGSVDPGLLLTLQERHGMGALELREVLTKRSGWLGVSGVSADLREVLGAADAGSARARLAYDRFVLSVRRAIGGMAAVLGGVDAVVFTGGIGEHSACVRSDAASALGFAGLEMCDEANERADGDADVATPSSRVRVLVIRSREDLAILNEVLRLRRSASVRPA